MRLRFYNGHGAAAWAIRTWTRGLFAHVEYSFDNGTYWGATATKGTAWGICPWAPEAQAEVSVHCTPMDEALIRGWCDNETGCEYDWKGIFFAQVLGLRREHPDKWFCSEAVWAGLQAAGLAPMRPRACSLDPTEVYRLLAAC